MCLGKFHLPLVLPLQIIQPPKFLMHQQTVMSTPGTRRNFLRLRGVFGGPHRELSRKPLKVSRHWEKQLKEVSRESKRAKQTTKSTQIPANS